MFEEPKVWPVMLIVAVMVLSVAAVMFIGAENELPAPQLPDNYQLRYSASVEYQDRTVNGTQTANYTGTSSASIRNGRRELHRTSVLGRL